MATDQASCPDITKPADIFCGYNLQPIVIFDIPRSRIGTMDHIYGVIEKFLNGMIFVGKYNSHQVCIKPPHVIVFSNDLPKIYNENGHFTLSKDRWNLIKIPRSVDDPLAPSKKRSRETENILREIESKHEADRADRNAMHNYPEPKRYKSRTYRESGEKDH